MARVTRTSLLGPLAGALLVVFGACQRPLPAPPPAPPDAGPPPPPPVDAGPGPLPGFGAEAEWDGGRADLMAPDASVPGGAELTLRTSAELSDVRVRIIDSEYRLRPNRLEIEAADGGTSFVLRPSEPLPSKLCCRLVIDGEAGSLPTDVGGRRFLPLVLHFSVWPAPATAHAKPGKQRRRRRRHHRS